MKKNTELQRLWWVQLRTLPSKRLTTQRGIMRLRELEEQSGFSITMQTSGYCKKDTKWFRKSEQGDFAC